MTQYLNIGARLRKILLEHPEGMTIAQLSKIDGSPQDTITGALNRGYGFYVGGWTKLHGVHWRAVWMVVRVPDRAPKPVDAQDADQIEAEKQRKAIEYKRRQLAERERLKAIRAKLKRQRDEERERHANEQAKIKAERKAVREQERLAREQRRAEREAKKQKPAPREPEYVPEKTFWQPVKPWSEGARA